jgi:phosphocarrier protein
MGVKKGTDTHQQVARDVMVLNKLGLHARPAALFVKTANKFKSEVFVEKDSEIVNGKSIIGLMMLAAGPGSVLRIKASGPDASDALDALESLFKKKFEEE